MILGGTAGADDSPSILRNGDLEERDRLGRPTSWYFVRQARLVTAEAAPDAGSWLEFTNHVPGRESQAQQSFALDASVRSIVVSLRVRARDARPGQTAQQRPQAYVVFYDELRRQVGSGTLGPWLGSFDWREEQAYLLVPRRACRAVLYIGLSGATGSADFDDVAVAASDVNPSALTPTRPN
jgi:protein-L-isoaspartate(D-aspartate) O-methyltransferase